MLFNQSSQVVLTLSDAKGFGSGGSSQLLKVGQSLGGSCNLTPPILTYTYGLNSPLVQCQAFPITDYPAATLPVTVFGVIPGGDSFALSAPISKTSFDWTADVYNGTEIVFLMVDALGQTGGSILSTVGLSGDASCINSQSPSSTIAPSSGSTSSPSSSSSPSAVPATPSTSNTGAIAGSVLGALVFLAVLITLGLFFLRQRQEKKNARMAGGNEFRRSRPLHPSEVDLTYDPQQRSTSPFMTASITPSSSAFNQTMSLSGAPSHYQPHSQYLASRPESENPFNPESTSHGVAGIDPFMEQGSDSTSAGQSSTQRKSGMSGFNYKPSRYVVHTDAEDDPAPNEDGIVELPPQYSATRAPARLPPSDTFTSPPL